MPQRAHALRIGRFSESSRVYLVTTVTHERQPLFADFWLARLAICELRKADNNGASKTLAFVVMPDHLHWLFELADQPLPKVVGQVKAGVSAAINQVHGTPGVQRWQKGFHDRALRREEDLPAVARYVVANPVRAGIVQRVGSYSHWDAIWL
jgi:REP element-mobilizing transposase RayT